MSRLFSSVPVRFLSALLVLASIRANAAPPDPESRKRVLELAAAFANDGFRVRDGFWTGHLEAGTGARVLEVNLYAGNAYWFCAATRGDQSAVRLSVHDASGAVLAADPGLGEGRCALCFEPKTSGPFYLRLTVNPGVVPGPASTPAPEAFSVVYSYK